MDPGDGNDTEDWQPEGVSGQCSSSSSIIKSQSVSVNFFNSFLNIIMKFCMK